MTDVEKVKDLAHEIYEILVQRRLDAVPFDTKSPLYGETYKRHKEIAHEASLYELAKLYRLSVESLESIKKFLLENPPDKKVA